MTGYMVVRHVRGVVNGLKARYYVWRGGVPPDDFSILELVHERIDPQINFTWWDSPAPGVPSGYFAVEWRALLKIPVAGIYRFYVVTDDGSRVWIDGELVIDAWKDQPPKAYHSRPITLDPGYHELVYRFYNRNPFAVARLGWLRPDGMDEVIPPEYFFVIKGDKIIIRGLPEGSRVELWSGRLLASGKEHEGIALLKTPEPHPIDGYFRVYRGNELLLESPVIRDIAGGDEYEIVEEGSES